MPYDQIASDRMMRSYDQIVWSDTHQNVRENPRTENPSQRVTRAQLDHGETPANIKNPLAPAEIRNPAKARTQKTGGTRNPRQEALQRGHEGRHGGAENTKPAGTQKPG